MKLPKPTKHNILFILNTAGLQLALACLFKWNALASLIANIIFMIMPCTDKQFGWGRPYFWVRQTIYGTAAIISLILFLIRF